MTGLIYKATNIVTKKVYVGQTTYSLRERKNAHLSDARLNKTTMYFHRAISKYGEEKFVWSVLEEEIPLDKLDEKEIYYIAKENSFFKGYNLSPGGSTNKGWKASPETIVNMSKAQKGRTFTETAKAKMSNAQKGTLSHKFKPWYMIIPDGSKVEFYDITIKDFAKNNGYSYSNLMYRVYNQEGIPAKKGILKGYIFGFLKKG